MKMKRMIQALASMAALFTLSSCFQSEVTINVKSDGSGTVVEETMFGAQMSAMLGMGGMMQDPNGKPEKNPLDQMTDEKTLKEKAKELGEGVTFVKAEQIEKDGKKGVRVTYAFEDINKLKIGMDEGSKNMEEMSPDQPDKKKEKSESQPIQFKFDDGDLTVILPGAEETAGPARNAAGAEEAADAMRNDPQAEALAKAMFSEMKIAVRLVVEPGIEKTDATHVDGNTITLMEMNFGELMQDKDAWKKFQSMKGKKPEEIGEALKEVKGVIFEAKKKIKVEMK